MNEKIKFRTISPKLICFLLFSINLLLANPQNTNNLHLVNAKNKKKLKALELLNQTEISAEISISNEYLTLYVETESSHGIGTFTLKTADGHDLLYTSSDHDAWSSYLTVQVDGVNYITGTFPEQGNPIYMNSYIKQFPVNRDNSIITEWELPENIFVTQDLSLNGESVEFKVTVTNQGTNNKSVKVRYLFDYQVKNQDGSPVYLESVGILVKERKFDNPFFDNWYTYDRIPEPTITGLAKIQTYPNQIIFCNWAWASDYPFDYDDFDVNRTFYTEGYTESPESDCCALLYWDLGIISPGGVSDVKTFYGIGEPGSGLTDRENLIQHLEQLKNITTSTIDFNAELISNMQAKTYIKAKVDGLRLMLSIAASLVHGAVHEVPKSLSKYVLQMHNTYKSLGKLATAEKALRYIERHVDNENLESINEDELPNYFLNDINTSIEIGDFIGLRSVKDHIEDRFNLLISSLPDPLPIDYPIDYVIDVLDKLTEVIAASTLYETWAAVNDESNKYCRQIPLGHLLSQKEHLDEIYAAYSTIKTVHSAATWSKIGLAGAKVVNIAVFLLTSGASTPVSAPAEVVIMKAFTATTLVQTGTSIVDASGREYLILTTNNAIGGFIDEIEKLEYVSVQTAYNIEKMTIAPISDNVDLLTSEVPNLILEDDFEIGGLIDGSATIRNNSTEKIPLTATVDIYPNNFSSTTQSFPIGLTTSDNYTLSANETKTLNFSAYIMRNALARCEGYTADIYLKIGPDKIIGPQSKIFYVGSNEQCDVYNQQDSYTVLSGALNTGEIAETSLQLSSESVSSYFTLTYPGSDLDLHVYDKENRHVGVNYQSGATEIHIPGASYNGPNNRPELIFIPKLEDKEYKVQVVALSASGSESYSVSATEILSRPVMLQAVPVSISLTTELSDSLNISETFLLREIGGQKGVYNIQGFSSDLKAGADNSISSSNISINLSANKIDAGSSTNGKVEVQIPFDIIPETYQGIVTITGVDTTTGDTANADIALSVTINSPTDVEDLKGMIPKKFQLYQNYPNPFNPSTTIKYDLPLNARVSLKIYNLLGQEVKTLVDENQKTGFKSVVWNAADDNGIKVSSGIYIYRIQMNDEIRCKKMIFLK